MKFIGLFFLWCGYDWNHDTIKWIWENIKQNKSCSQHVHNDVVYSNLIGFIDPIQTNEGRPRQIYQKIVKSPFNTITITKNNTIFVFENLNFGKRCSLFQASGNLLGNTFCREQLVRYSSQMISIKVCFCTNDYKLYEPLFNKWSCIVNKVIAVNHPHYNPFFFHFANL